MRIGSVLLVLLLVLIGSGYLLSENIHMQADLTEARSQVAQMTRKIKDLQSQLSSLHTEEEQLRNQVSQLTADNEQLRQQNVSLQSEKDGLEAQNGRLRAENDTLKLSLPMPWRIFTPGTNSIFLALFVPILPLSLGLTYAAARYSIRRIQRISSSASKGQKMVDVKLTPEEVRQLIKFRRHLR